MNRQRITKPVILLAIFLMVLTVYAGMHFVGGVRFGFGSLDANADLSGFGSDTDSITVTLSASGTGLTAMKGKAR